MSIALIIGLGVVLLIVAIALMQRSGPRVAVIETRSEDEDGKKDDGDA